MQENILKHLLRTAPFSIYEMSFIPLDIIKSKWGINIHSLIIVLYSKTCAVNGKQFREMNKINLQFFQIQNDSFCIFLV